MLFNSDAGQSMPCLGHEQDFYGKSIETSRIHVYVYRITLVLDSFTKVIKFEMDVYVSELIQTSRSCQSSALTLRLTINS